MVYSIVLPMRLCIALKVDLHGVQAVCAMYHSCETECGAILFWQYMASIVCIPVWMVVFLTLMYQFDHV